MTDTNQPLRKDPKAKVEVESYAAELDHGGRDEYYVDIDRMINEGLGGGQVTLHNGLISDSTTDTIEPESDPRGEE